MEQMLLLLAGGIVVGILGATLGGTMFISLPFWQFLFPQFNYGQITGNIKVGSLFRGIASSWITWKKINFRETGTLLLTFAAGTIVSSIFVANLNQIYLLVAVILSIVISELSPKIAHLIKPKTRMFFAFILGIYMGILGAGIGILLVALMRTVYSAENDIVKAKIQARFIETAGTIGAIAIHIYYNNILFPYWLIWSIGSFIGGYIGGHILNKTVHVSAKTQHFFLVCVYIIAIIPFIVNFIEYL